MGEVEVAVEPALVEERSEPVVVGCESGRERVLLVHCKANSFSSLVGSVSWHPRGSNRATLGFPWPCHEHEVRCLCRRRLLRVGTSSGFELRLF